MNKYESEIVFINNHIKTLKKRIDDIKKEWIENESPVNIGDKVIVNGYSFEGKEMIVKSISVIEGYKGMQFLARGNIIKNDGSEGNRTADWYSKGR